MRAKHGTFGVEVEAVEQVTPLIRLFRLVDPAGQLLPGFSGGSHILVLIEDGVRTYRNPYSLVSSPFDTRFYEIAVALQPEGRGGSRVLHERIRKGARLEISYPANQFPLEPLARKHLLVAGGVGLTPALAQLRELEFRPEPFELHYAVRSRAHAGLVDRVPASLRSRVTLHCEDEVGRIDFERLLDGQPLGTHLYVCGPKGMLEQALDSARACGWPDSHIHFELFAQQAPGVAFEATFVRSGRRVQVPPELSLLEAAEAAGVDLPYLCRGGACGQCETAVLELDGEIEHRDIWLNEADRMASRKIMPCVSRARCTRLVLDA